MAYAIVYEYNSSHTEMHKHHWWVGTKGHMPSDISNSAVNVLHCLYIHYTLYSARNAAHVTCMLHAYMTVTHMLQTCNMSV